jgi:hypothetical protein
MLGIDEFSPIAAFATCQDEAVIEGFLFPEARKLGEESSR